MADLIAWEQIEDETAKAFEGFRHYRDLPPRTRSIRVAAAVALGLDPAGKLTVKQRQRLETRKRSFEGWSVDNAWVERARQYDQHCDRERRADRAELVRQVADAQRELGTSIRELAAATIEKMARDEIDPGFDGGKGAAHRTVLAYAMEGSKLEAAALGYDIPESVGSALPQERVRELLTSDPQVAVAAVQLALAESSARRRAAGEER